MSVQRALLKLVLVSAALGDPSGRIYHRGDTGYDSVRIASYNSTTGKNSAGNINTVFSGVYPATIVLAETVTDVANTIKWAASANMRVAPRGGGHAYDGCSLMQGGVVIDVSLMNKVKVLPSGLVRVEAGAKIGPVNVALNQHGLALPSGSCSTVGIAGLTLGGGHGVLARQYGLTMDRLDSVEVVLANGTVVTASPSSHQALFWALKGAGGGNFGVVTAFVFRTVPAQDFYFYRQEREWDPATLLKWQQWAPQEPAASWHTVHILTDGRATMRFEGLYSKAAGGFDRGQGRVVAGLGPFQRRGYGWPPEVWNWEETYENMDWAPDNVPHVWLGTSAYIKPRSPLTAAGLDALHSQFGSIPEGCTIKVNLDAYGGEIAKVAKNGSAFPHRDALYSMQILNIINNASAVEAGKEWMRQFRVALAPFQSGEYRNYADIDLRPDLPSQYYGQNLERLKELKQAYDPHGLFGRRANSTANCSHL